MAEGKDAKTELVELVLDNAVEIVFALQDNAFNLKCEGHLEDSERLFGIANQINMLFYKVER